MSVAGICSSSVFNYLTQSAQSTQSKGQQFRKEFQQLGKDLQAGDVSAAQADFATIQQQRTQSKPTSATSDSSLTKDADQLSQDLQSGNLAGAQQDFAKIQQDAQPTSTTQTQGHHHHHHHGGPSPASTDSTSGANDISQLLGQLGQALQSGNLSNAQTAYTSLQQDFTNFLQTNGISLGASSMDSSGIAVNA